MKKCKNCSKCKDKNSKSASKKLIPQSVGQIIQSQYGLSAAPSSPRIQVYNDDYMLVLLHKTHKKTHKLQKEVKNLKHQLKHLQKSVDHLNNEHRNSKKQNVSKIYIQQPDEGQSGEQEKSEFFSVNTSKNRQVGRFTRVSQRQSRSSSTQREANLLHTFQLKPKLKQNQKSSKIVKQVESHPIPKQQYKKLKEQPVFKQIITHEVEHQQSENNGIEAYLPSYQQVQDSYGSNLLQQNEHEQIDNSQAKKARLQREFQDLTIKQKKADGQQKKLLRKQLNTICQLIRTLQR